MASLQVVCAAMGSPTPVQGGVRIALSSLSRRKNGSWKFSDLPKVTSGHTAVQEEPGSFFLGNHASLSVLTSMPAAVFPLRSSPLPASEARDPPYPGPPALPVPGQRDPRAG